MDMAYDTAGQHDNSTDRTARLWAVSLAVIGALVGVPALVLAEFEFGLLTALGITSNLAFGLVVMVPGFALGGLAFAVMLGS